MKKGGKRIFGAVIGGLIVLILAVAAFLTYNGFTGKVISWQNNGLLMENATLKDYAGQRGLMVGIFKGGSLSEYNTNPALMSILKEFNVFMDTNQYGKRGIWNGPYTYNLSVMDLQKGLARDTGEKILGGALVWDDSSADTWLDFWNYTTNSQNPDCGGWYPNNVSLRDSKKNELDLMLHDYIKQVVQYGGSDFMGWEVVNEPIYSGKASCWYKIFGEDYINKSFTYAREAAVERNLDLNLMLNEYIDHSNSTLARNKTDELFSLVQRLKNGGTPIDVVGLQAHLGDLNSLSPQYIDDVKYFFDKAKEANVSVYITEFDVYQGVPPLGPIDDIDAMREGYSSLSFNLSDGYRYVLENITQSDYNLTIGATRSGSLVQNNFNGMLADISLYNRSLSFYEIHAFNYPPYVGNGPLLYLPLDEDDWGSGVTVFADRSGNGMNASCSGTTCPKAGVWNEGSHALFDGNDYLNVGNLSKFGTIGSFSAFARVYRNSSSPWQRIMGKAYYDNTTRGSWMIMVGDSDNVDCLFNINNKWYNAISKPGSFPVGDWRNVGCVYDGNYLKAYVDGVESGSVLIGGVYIVASGAVNSNCNNLSAPKATFAMDYSSVPYLGEYQLAVKAFAPSNLNNSICVQIDRGNVSSWVLDNNANSIENFSTRRWSAYSPIILSEGDPKITFYMNEPGLQLNSVRFVLKDTWRYNNSVELENEKEVYKRVILACLNSSVCKYFQTWGISDNETWLYSNQYLTSNSGFYPDARPLMWDFDYQKKPAYYGVVEALNGVNITPVISLVSPKDVDVFTAPANITINVTPINNGEMISRVEFYNGNNLLATVMSEPYVFEWTNVTEGSYVLIAKAYDDQNISTSSNSVTIGVQASGGDGGSGGGGSSGGGGGGSSGAGNSASNVSTVNWSSTYAYNDRELKDKGVVQRYLGSRQRASLLIDGDTHYVGVTDVASDHAGIIVSSAVQTAELALGENKTFDVNNDGYYDLDVRLDIIDAKTGEAYMSMWSVHEKVPGSETQPAGNETTIDNQEQGNSHLWIWIVALIVAVLIVAFSIYRVIRMRRSRFDL